MPKIYWDDVEDIAIALSERFPDIDPLTVRFTDLHQWITEIGDFADPDAGDLRLNTDWEIWTTGANPQRVWFALAQTGPFDDHHVRCFNLRCLKCSLKLRL